MRHLLLSFNGRIKRKDYWIGILILALFATVTALATGLFAALMQVQNPQELFHIVGYALLLPIGYLSLALMVKRIHDHGKSGWWVLPCLIPYVGALAAFIWLGCMEGQPLETSEDAPSTTDETDD